MRPSARSQRTSIRMTSGKNQILPKGNPRTPSSSPESVSTRKLVMKPVPLIDWTQMVTIECVDEDGNEQTFVVHKTFITHHSPYYQAVFNGRFSEGQTQSMKQFPISVESFGIFVRWIYTQRLENGEGALPSIKDLINLWIFADEKLIQRLQNQVIEALNEEFGKEEEMPTDLFVHVYRHTSEGSALRRLIVHICMAKLGKAKIEEENFPRPMLVDLINASLESKSSKSTKLSKDKLKSCFVEEEVPQRR